MVSIDFGLGLCRAFRNTNLFQVRGVPLSWTTSPHPTAINSATPPATSGQCPPQHQTSCEGRKALQLNVDFRRYRAMTESGRNEVQDLGREGRGNS